MNDAHRSELSGAGGAPGAGGALERVRALCLALPEVSEKLSHGEPTWFVRKVFVSFADRHHDDRVAFWACRSTGTRWRT